MSRASRQRLGRTVRKLRVRPVSSRHLGVSGVFIGTSSGDVSRVRVATRQIPSPILPQHGFIAVGYERWLFRLRVVVMRSPGPEQEQSDVVDMMEVAKSDEDLIRG